MLDTVSGFMARQVLLNVRIDPIVVSEILPSTFKPVLRHRYAVGGISLMRFENLTSDILPVWLAPHSECAAFWFAVEWESNGIKHRGAYVPRRESNSFHHRSFGDRPYTGIFRRSHFDSEETDNCIRTRVLSIDDTHEIEFHGHMDGKVGSNSIFSTVEEASEFLMVTRLGYSESEYDGIHRGVELIPGHWNLEPVTIRSASSSFFDTRSLFPPGSLEIDSAFVLRNLAHEWRYDGELAAPPDPTRINSMSQFKGLTASAL